MTKGFSRRAFLVAALSSGAAPLWAKGPSVSLRPVARSSAVTAQSLPAFQALIDKAKLGGDSVFTVAHVESGLILEEHNPTLGMPPASVAKALTATYALAVLGPDFRFTTRLRATGPLENGTLKGDLVLVGGGDPTLDTNGLAALAADLKAMGVASVEGRFLVFGSVFPKERVIDADQPDQVGYNPAVSGLNLNYNRVHFEWRPASGGYAVTMDARSDKYRPDVQVASMQIVDRAAPVYTYSDVGGRDVWTVAQGALGKGGARWLPVRRPEIYAGEVFQTFARSHGINLGKPQEAEALPDGVDLASLQSAPLTDILRDMLKYSTNLTAEAVGIATTIEYQGKPASLRASAEAMNRWSREVLGLQGVAMVDHSGLGANSRMTSSAMVSALIAARRGLELKPLLKDVPMRDEKRRVVEDHPALVRAKTGTLNFVSGLAGYLDTPDGTELAFAIFSANHGLRDELTVEERERPPGGRAWNSRARVLQQDLLDRWGVLYGT